MKLRHTKQITFMVFLEIRPSSQINVTKKEITTTDVETRLKEYCRVKFAVSPGWRTGGPNKCKQLSLIYFWTLHRVIFNFLGGEKEFHCWHIFYKKKFCKKFPLNIFNSSSNSWFIVCLILLKRNIEL